MARFVAQLLAAALAAVALGPLPASARFVIEEGGLRVVLPDDAKKQYPMGFDMALANFGAPGRQGFLCLGRCRIRGCTRVPQT